MINVNELKGKIVARGKNVAQIAEEMGIDKSTLYRKLEPNGDLFTIREATMISKILCLSMEDVNAIFFAKEVA